MLCGLPLVQQAAIGDGLSFDPFSFDQYGLTAVEVDVGWRPVADAFVISQVIVVSDGPFNAAGNPAEFRGLDRCAAIQLVMAWESAAAYP
jgi:hypothetical protein